MSAEDPHTLESILLAPRSQNESDSNDYRPGDLTAHIFKTPVRLVLAYIRPRERAHVDPLQFAYQLSISKSNAHIHMLQRDHASLDTTDALWIGGLCCLTY